MFHALGIWARGTRLGLTRPGRLRRTAFTLALFLGWSAVRVIVAVGRGLDHVFFPGFRRREIRAPVYIVGAPRSGTTFLHELLALDEERFTSLRLYETLLPSIVLCRGIEALGALDRAIGRPLGRLVAAAERRAFGGWRGIHATAFARHEEPEGLWVLRMTTPAVYLLFPFFGALPEPSSLDGLTSDRVRRSAIDFYVGSLKRHLHMRAGNGGERTLLVKTVLFFSRQEAVTTALPGIRFVYLSRAPESTIPSALSMLTRPWVAHSPQAVGATPETRSLADLLLHGYRRYADLREATPSERWVDIAFSDLIERPVDAVASICRHFGFEPADGLADLVRARADAARSRAGGHSYGLERFGLTTADLDAGIRDRDRDPIARPPGGP